MDVIETLTPEQFVQRFDEILKILSDETIRARIPLISNLTSFDGLKDLQIVRFRGLVQNMLDPEIYLESYQTKNGDVLQSRNGKYRDNFSLEENEEILFDAHENVHGERRPLFMVSIPGLNDWAIDIENGSAGDKCMETDATEHGKGTKRPLDENDQQEMDVDGDTQTKRSNAEKTDAEKLIGQPINLSREYLLNAPIKDRPSNACLVKFYDDAGKVSLNDVLDVVGFISMDAKLCGSNRQPDDFENFDEICAMNPPPSLIPRLHAISYRPVNHLNPLLHDNRTQNESSKFDCFHDIRKILAQCLFGDEVAADYLFCHLISTVYVRSDETLGQFSLNIANFPSEHLRGHIKQLYEVIESCMPASHYFPLTVDNLNTTEFIPTKDYETGKLNSGLLQLAPHTHLVLDETCLEAGKLESHGIEAVVHISNVIRKQQLNVNFKFYAIDYNVNIPVLILSEGKSMLPSNCHIPLKVDADALRLIDETFAAMKQFLKPRLVAIRCFLTEMRLRDFDMNPQNMQLIQDDFIQMRNEFKATADDLHIMLILSRLLGIIQGKSTLDEESWNKAKSMEVERRKRIAALPQLKTKN